MSTLQLPSLKFARNKRLHECPGASVCLIISEKHLHSLSLQLMFSFAECKYIFSRYTEVTSKFKNMNHLLDITRRIKGSYFQLISFSMSSLQCFVPILYDWFH